MINFVFASYTRIKTILYMLSILRPRQCVLIVAITDNFMHFLPLFVYIRAAFQLMNMYSLL